MWLPEHFGVLKGEWECIFRCVQAVVDIVGTGISEPSRGVSLNKVLTGDDENSLESLERGV